MGKKHQRVQVGNDQETERNLHSKNRSGKTFGKFTEIVGFLMRRLTYFQCHRTPKMSQHTPLELADPLIWVKVFYALV